MATYPGGIPSFTTPNASDKLNNPSHSALHTQEYGEIVAICTALGAHIEGAYATADARFVALETSLGVTDWTRVATTLQPFHANDNVNIGTGDYTGHILNLTNATFTLQIDPTALAANRTVAAEDLYQATANQHVAATAGTGISVLGQAITNTAPDQTVSIASGTGINATGTYPSFTVTNTAPDQTVAIASGTGINATGTYPSFTVALSHLGIQNLTDPGADRLMFWDESSNYAEWLTLGTNLSITGTTINATGGATLTRATFTNASLSAGVLTITHSAALSAPYTVMVVIFDNNGKQIIPDEITGSTNSVAVDLSSFVTAGGGSITGTWGYGYIA